MKGIRLAGGSYRQDQAANVFVTIAYAVGFVVLVIFVLGIANS